ncbi:MAG: MFS transporter [Pseudomonadota bacterium]
MNEPEITPRKVLIAVTCLVCSAFVPFVQATIGPMMMLPMINEFGWTRTQYAFATTFLFVFGSITVLIFGRMADRFGPRTILLLGAICGGATMLLLSQQNAQLWRLYLAFGLLGAFGSTGLGYTKIIGTLFARHRGKALAIFGAESTIALGTLPLLTNTLNVNLGWRGTYLVYAVIMFVLTPVLFFVIRGPGLSDAARTKSLQAAPVASAPLTLLEGLTPPQIRRDRAFWLVVLTAMLGSGLNVGLTAHIIAAITDKGFTQTVAAQVLSAATLVGLVGTLAVGFAMDYFRTARFMSVVGLLSAIGAFLFAMASATVGGLPLLIGGLAIQRTAMAAMPAATNYMQTRFVGMRSFGEAFAMQVVVVGIAMGITPPLFGMIYEKYGSYAPVYWIVVGGAAVGAVVYLLLGPYRYAAKTSGPRLA